MNQKIKSIFSIFSLIFIFSIQVFGQTSLTIDRAVQLAVGSHPEIHQAKASISVSDAKLEYANGSYYPVVTASANYTWINPISEVNFGAGTFKTNPENNYGAQIGAQYLLYDFGRRSTAVDAALTGKLAAEENVELVTRNLAYQTIQVFYSALFLKNAVSVQNEQLNALNTNLSYIQKKLDSGSATDFDILSTKVKIAAAENTRIDLQNNLNTQLILLKRLTGIPEKESVDLNGNFEFGFSDINMDSLISNAVQNRIELKMAKTMNQSAIMKKSTAEKDNNPYLVGNVSWGLKNGYLPNFDAIRGTYIVGFQLQVPIFDGNKTESEVHEAEANIRSSESKIEDVQLQINSDVRTAMENLNSCKQKLQTTDAQVDQAKKAVEQARIRYKNELITNLDLLSSEVSLSQAQLANLQAKYTYQMANYQLKRAIGEKIW